MSGEDDLFASTMALWRDQQNQEENSANWANSGTENPSNNNSSKPTSGKRVSRKLMVMFGLIIIVIALLLSATFISSKRQKKYTDSQIIKIMNGTTVSTNFHFTAFHRFRFWRPNREMG